MKSRPNKFTGFFSNLFGRNTNNHAGEAPTVAPVLQREDTIEDQLEQQSVQLSPPMLKKRSTLKERLSPRKSSSPRKASSPRNSSSPRKASSPRKTSTLRKSTSLRKSTKSMKTLEPLLKDGEHRPVKFELKLLELADTMSDADIKRLAVTAIRTGHAEELDALAGTFGHVLTPRYIEDQLLSEDKSEIFQDIILADADPSRKLETLKYMLDPTGSFNIVGDGDNERLRQSYDDSFKLDNKVTVVVNTEQYASSHQVLSQQTMRDKYQQKLFRMSCEDFNSLGDYNSGSGFDRRDGISKRF